MTRDTLFSDTAPRATDFVFDERVATVFDDMVARSVPSYQEQQRMVVSLARSVWRPGGVVVDLGCATATTLINLRRALEGPGSFIGYDNSPAMIEQARGKVRDAGLDGRIELREGDISSPDDLQLDSASLVTLCWTLQFVRPPHRDRLIQSIYSQLAPGGMLVITEKILARDPRVNRLFIDLYYELKASNGYSATEIAKKREALENVLVPYTIDENLELLRRNGFPVCESFFQWHNFAGFLAIKAD